MAELDISVVIPVYNSKNTIMECLKSVVSELKANPYTWEIICVNDGSKDDSVDIINKYVADLGFDDTKIRVITQENAGAGVARATGIKAARGEFIAFDDSDDKWLPGKIKYQMDYFKANPDVGMIGAMRKEIKKNITDIQIVTMKQQMSWNHFYTSTVIFKKKYAQEYALAYKLRYSEDFLFFNSIVNETKSVLMPNPLCNSVDNKNVWGDSGLSANLWAMQKGELYAITQSYKNHYISFPLFIMAYIWSLIKYVRRVMMRLIRKFV